MSENKLGEESSPYLLQHAKNPVNWHGWNSESLEKAKSENKPIFLSVGYSSCHWCHVMAHESFENEDIARVLNDNFINIKVDREERPNIAERFLDICRFLKMTYENQMTIIPFMCNIMHVDLTDYQLTKEDKERIHLLSIVEKKGLKPLNLENLRLLERLVEKKDYGTSKKAQKAKIKLLNKINVAIYELSEGKPGI